MKTQKTKDMEQALINYSLSRYRPIALEVPFWHTCDIGCGIYQEEGQMEIIDAVSEHQGGFTCYELKVSMTDLHSKTAQSYLGNKNYLVCPRSMAEKIIKTNDSWLEKYPDVGIMAWDGKESFRIIKRCKINYGSLPVNDWKTLAQGMLLKMSEYMSWSRIQINRLRAISNQNKKHHEGA